MSAVKKPYDVIHIQEHHASNDDIEAMAKSWVSEGNAAVQSSWMDIEEAAHRLGVKLNRPKDFMYV